MADQEIVPRFMLRRIEAARRYPVQDGHYPGVDRNAAAREAFIAGATWADESWPEDAWVAFSHGPENDDSPTPDWERGPNRGSG